MNKQMVFAIVLIACLVSMAFCESTQSPLPWSRMLIQFGFGQTIGDPLSKNDIGYVAMIRNYFYFDPRYPDGLYYGLMGTSIVHTAGSIKISDIRWGTLGYRTVVGPEWFSVNSSISFVQGARMTGTAIKGSGYMGFSPSIGANIAYNDDIDLGIAVEPVINVFSVNSNQFVKAKSYCDIVFYLSLKKLFRTESRHWGEAVQ